jgi:hypothetical protein
MVRAGRMTGLASFNSWQQQVTGIGTAQDFFVAVHASKTSMSFVVEFCVRHPTGGDVGFGNVRQNVFGRRRDLKRLRQFGISIERELVALQASLAPQKLLGVRGSNRNPLCGG